MPEWKETNFDVKSVDEAKKILSMLNRYRKWGIKYYSEDIGLAVYTGRRWEGWEDNGCDIYDLMSREFEGKG